MICKFCGMDSVTTEVCSWCGKSLRIAAAPDSNREEVSASAPVQPEDIVASELDAASTLSPTAKPVKTAPPVPARPAQAGVPSAGAAASARKVAPGMPMSSRLRTPAPPPPSVPLASLESAAGSTAAGSNVTSHMLPLADTPGAPLASSLNAPSPGATPSLLQQAAALTTSVSAIGDAAYLSSPESVGAAPASVERDFTRRDFSTPVLQTPSAATSASVPPEQTIGTGVSPQRGTTTPATLLAPTIDDKQRKAAVDAALADTEPSSKGLLLRYAGVLAILLIVAGALCLIGKQFYVVPMLVAMFIGALLLPVMRVTPWADEDSDDLIWFVLLTLLFGPLVALIIYSFVSLIRQGCNASILGCLVVAALVRITAEVASGGVTITNLIAMTSPFTSLSHIDEHLGRTLLLNWSGFTALAGWYAASAFHKEDE